MEKQDLQTGESEGQNSNSALARPRNKRHEDMRKMALNHAKIRLKNNRSILG